ncbi:acyl-ACP thioesterase domain-containing protein [Myroides sp. DF42-4-2]|uniref:acyl-[acyl-carrier-protein] thioesterase n=1 Tax=unclassified Myroides TaxID=2642485 RepID=UPI002577951E|nr:acyl-ACP thioesterase domain-containing protein [Myroides sp. DF42-4-2]MDM1408868.1 acyl-ACP thioesterase [Myroides sp. DF42-4-2]
MPISDQFTSIHQQSYEIDFFACSPSGRLKWVDLCKFIQSASADHSVLGGISFWDLKTHNQAWVLSKFRIEKKAELPQWQDKITIHTWIERLDGVRSIRNFEVYLGDLLIAVASSLWVIINTERRRPELIALPHEHFIKYTDKKVTDTPFAKLHKGNYQPIDQVRVKLSDLDMVKHVTNIKYLEWCIDAAFTCQEAVDQIQVIDMHFLKETRINDRCDVLFLEENNMRHYQICVEGVVHFYCFMN